MHKFVGSVEPWIGDTNFAQHSSHFSCKQLHGLSSHIGPCVYAIIGIQGNVESAGGCQWYFF